MSQNSRDYSLSQSSGSYARQAIQFYANAAACEELLNDGSHNENQMFFVVRALCVEHGLDYKSVVDIARDNALTLAQQRIARVA